MLMFLFWKLLFNHVNQYAGSSKQKIAEEIQKIGKAKVSARIFTFRELLIATDNFNPGNLIGEGGFGRVYKGYIESIDKVNLFSLNCFSDEDDISCMS